MHGTQAVNGAGISEKECVDTRGGFVGMKEMIKYSLSRSLAMETMEKGKHEVQMLWALYLPEWKVH